MITLHSLSVGLVAGRPGSLKEAALCQVTIRDCHNTGGFKHTNDKTTALQRILAMMPVVEEKRS